MDGQVRKNRSHALTPAQGLERGRDGGEVKGHEGHTGMIYNSGGMRHRCWSLVIVNTERGRQVGDVVLHHGPPGNRDVTSAPIRSW